MPWSREVCRLLHRSLTPNDTGKDVRRALELDTGVSVCTAALEPRLLHLSHQYAVDACSEMNCRDGIPRKNGFEGIGSSENGGGRLSDEGRWLLHGSQVRKSSIFV